MAKLKVKESDIQKAIKEYLQWQGWYVCKIHQSLGSFRGIADLVATKDGQTVWVEVKTPRGRQSIEQIEFQQGIETHGGRYVLAESVEDVRDLRGKKLVGCSGPEITD